ncbi:CPXCG motif-containing cysteine-rich protein [Nonlabens tegetincola]|uniref:CPXCG motif-containing cysteine-rich protein n=1 Tax=Nonlabens tegetincola TaxID=323273 RepID=UPI000CF3F29F|nr:CPXCG motif-containing cysteine-rich protein [Nonlabens tegetincola]PQJ13945.1 CPXCG motif-containing cysteine-rich protein [Nonlabens tegetincola]
MIEHFFMCPHCWQEISMLLDPAYSQNYVEDCEVCCNPIEIKVVFENGSLESFNAKELGQ